MNTTPLWVAITLPLLGFAVAIRSEILRSYLQSRREAAARVHDRQERLKGRRDEFELAVLKNAYASLNRLARAAMRFHLIDLQVAEVVGSYASRQTGDQTGPELEEEFLKAKVQLATELELVLDDNLRAQLEATRDALLTPSAMYNSEAAEAQKAMNRALAMTDETQRSLGARIRELYAVSAVV
ncbi:hypothetical protein GCM10027404_22340 [Arthrobacter tumbae]|uniref:hypothetical protein n=1 Tax=Arthrobacter tumbae TaxID=163874 RepID=UPI001956F0B0|nr:hypothetical protein [Arthrobacter tumbae]MBM7781260.1 hypothetical protein [Arthrobacter tumbae]